MLVRFTRAKRSIVRRTNAPLASGVLRGEAFCPASILSAVAWSSASRSLPSMR